MAFIYGIQSGLFVKIGVANNIIARLKTMNLYNPHPCKVILRRECYGNAYRIEKEMHRILAAHSIGREWFTVSQEQAREAFKVAQRTVAKHQLEQVEWEKFSAERAAKRPNRLGRPPVDGTWNESHGDEK